MRYNGRINERRESGRMKNEARFPDFAIAPGACARPFSAALSGKGCVLRGLFANLKGIIKTGRPKHAGE